MGRGPFYYTLLSVNESGQTQRGWAGSWSRGEGMERAEVRATEL